MKPSDAKASCLKSIFNINILIRLLSSPQLPVPDRQLSRALLLPQNQDVAQLINKREIKMTLLCTFIP